MENFFGIFQSFRTIFCICPNCGGLVRLSDLKIFSKGKQVKTWLDVYEHKMKTIETKQEKFEEMEDKIRKKAAERGRKKVEKKLSQLVSEKFAKTKFNPYDIKAVWHPVDFVVFNGMNDGNVKNIIFLSKTSGNNALEKVRLSVRETIEKEGYDWAVARISNEGKIVLEQ
jgi:predicted Holliday junction resolvase-like endonuclease